MYLKIFNNESFFIKVSSILLIFLPISLITGPFISDLSISLIGIFFLTFCFTEKKFFYFKNRFFYFFFLFWLYIVLNSLINNFNFESLKTSFFYLRFPIFCIACVYIIENNFNVVRYFYYSLALCFLILIIDGFVQQLFGSNLLGFEKLHPNRVSSFFKDELILGSYMSRLSPIFFGLSMIFLKNRNLRFLFLFILFFLINCLIFFSGERTSFFLFNLSVFFIIIFLKNFNRYRLKVFLVVVFSMFVLISNSKDFQKRIIQTSIEQLKPMISGKPNYYFSTMHSDHYNTAFKMFYDNKLLGVGVKNFRKFCSNEKYSTGEYSCSTHPHNTLIQILAETGIIGFIFYLYIIFFILKKFIFVGVYNSYNIKRCNNDFKVIIFSALIITIFPFIPAGNVFNNWLNVVYWISVPFFLQKSDKFKI